MNSWIVKRITHEIPLKTRAPPPTLMGRGNNLVCGCSWVGFREAKCPFTREDRELPVYRRWASSGQQQVALRDNNNKNQMDDDAKLSLCFSPLPALSEVSLLFSRNTTFWDLSMNSV